MALPHAAKPATARHGGPASNSEQLGGELGIIDTPNTAIIQDVLSEMVGGVDITDLWSALMGDTP